MDSTDTTISTGAAYLYIVDLLRPDEPAAKHPECNEGVTKLLHDNDACVATSSHKMFSVISSMYIAGLAVSSLKEIPYE